MFRRSPRTIALWTAAVLLAIVTATVVVTTLSSLRRQDEAFGAIHDVVIARRDLPVGTRVAASDLRVLRVRGEVPAADTVTTPGAAIGRVVRTTLLAHATVTRRHLTASRRGALGDVVPADRRAFRAVIEHGLAPEPGDLVDIMATFDPQTLGDADDPTVVIAPGVPVLRTEGARDAGDTVAVTVIVTPHQASRLAFAAVAGTLSLSLAPPEAGTGP